MSFERRAYAVFKGGGVAGIAHVGALRELEKTFQFIGYAGTSAGSIVALMAAAGLTAEKIADALEELEFRSLIGPYRHLVRCMRSVLGLGLLSFVAWLLAWLAYWIFRAKHPPIAFEWVLAVVGFVVSALVGYVSLSLGLVPKKRLRKFLTGKIRDKMPGFDEHTTFSEFYAQGGKLLRIFATDLSGKTLMSFGGAVDEGVSVVEAVLASAAFPLFFLPGKIQGRCLTDGGVACNLPVFAFDRDLEQFSLPVIAFDLIWKEHPKDGRLGIVDFLVRLVTSAVQSHEAIVENLTTRVLRLRIRIPEEIGVMDFGLTREAKRNLIRTGEEAAREFLKLESVTPLSKEAVSLVQYIQAQHAPERLMVPLLRNFCAEAEAQLKVAKPRACIFMPVSGALRRIVYHTFAEEASDKDIELTAGEGIAGIAWETRRIALGILPGQGLNPEKTKLISSDRRSAFCVPLFRVEVSGRLDMLKRPLLGVLALDSSSSFEELQWPNDAEAMVRLDKLGKRWADTFSKLIQ